MISRKSEGLLDSIVSLNQLKEIVTEHMKREIDIMFMTTKLTKEESIEFKKWYEESPYCKAITEIQEIVRRTGNTETEKEVF